MFLFNKLKSQIIAKKMATSPRYKVFCKTFDGGMYYTEEHAMLPWLIS